MTPADEELVDQLKRQNAQLLRALVRMKGERDVLLKQLAALRPVTPADAAGAGR
jgi:hypothetical protein